MKKLQNFIALLFAALAATLVATSSFAADLDEAARKDYWQKRYEMVLNQSSAAETRLAAAERALRKARHRDRLKGQARIDINLELDAARKEAEAARVSCQSSGHLAQQRTPLASRRSRAAPGIEPALRQGTPLPGPQLLRLRPVEAALAGGVLPGRALARGVSA